MSLKGVLMISVRELLEVKGYDCSKIKIVRHSINEFNRFKDDFINYERYQSKPIFHKCDYIMTFIAIDGKTAIFNKFYKVISYTYDKETDHFYYDYEVISEFEPYHRKMVIDWSGVGIRTWHQWVNNGSEKQIISFKPEQKKFPGIYNVILTFSEMNEMINNEITYETWHTVLKNTKAIYLISDLVTGKQYVGSAYGEDGIYGRWLSYSLTKHGGNKGIIKYLNKNKDAYLNFQFSILQTLSYSVPTHEVIEVENLWKQKLNTYSPIGLNEN